MCYKNVLRSLNTDGNKLQKSVFRHFWVQQNMQKFDSHERNETITSFSHKTTIRSSTFLFSYKWLPEFIQDNMCFWTVDF